MERLYNWLLLKAIRGLGEVSIKRLWLAFGSAEDILSASYEDLREMVGEERARAIKRKDLSFEPEEVIRLVEREDIGWVCLEDEAYPPSLREIEDPPPVLFYRGEIRQVPMIGIVGTRKPDSQSLGFIKSLVREVVSKGYGVCSGGAIGCDFYSHKECLALGGYTVCLLGMGILKIPAYLSKLQNGNMLFLSEFLPEASPEEYTFPRRNRLISGLSKALVVAEAGQKSGSLITAQYAIKQKKPLWVYVGNALSQRWLGCINLVNEGKAKVLYSPTLLFQELPSSDSLKDPLLDLLTTPKTFDELLEITRLSHQELTMRLTQLELEGKVLRNGSYYMSL